MFEMIIIQGLITGGLYSILSVGFALAFGTARILNLSHTSFYMCAAFFLFICTTILKLPFLLSCFAVIPAVSILGMICYKVFLDRIKEHEIAVLIITTGIALLFQEVFLLGFHGHYRSIPPIISGFTQFLNFRITFQQIFAIIGCFVTIIGIWILLSYTKMGIAIRAVSQNKEAANLMGINVNRICMITIGISIGIAGIAAVAVAPIYVVHPLMWVHLLIVVLAAVVLGGLGSIRGVIIASFILGFAESIVVFLVPGGGFLKGAFSLIVMVIVLLLKPEGLFGVVFEEERL
ncbi:branched-chain amino acid ABC transporter permease [Thermodesulfobacteriota bacterium]